MLNCIQFSDKTETEEEKIRRDLIREFLGNLFEPQEEEDKM